jgi:hypothetical protein
MQFDRYIGQTPIKNLHIPRSKILIGEYGGFCLEFDQYTDRTRIKFFDRILTSNPINKIRLQECSSTEHCSDRIL